MKRVNIEVALLSILALFAVGVTFRAAQTVLIPLMIAWLLSYIFGPVVNFLVHKRVPLGVAVMAVLVLVLGVCYLGGLFLIGRIQTFAESFPEYAEKLQVIYADLMNALQQKVNLPSDAFAAIDWVTEVGGRLVTMTKSLTSFAGKLVLVLIFLIFMLLGKPYFQYKIKKAFPGNQAERIGSVMQSIALQIGKYLTVKVGVSAVTGLLVWVGLTLLGVEFALTWGALAFFLNFIPSVGSIIASIPPILLALVQFYPSVWMAVVTAVVLLSIQMMMGNGLEPKLLGDSLNLSPVVILMSLVFFGWLWGITGALMSVPIAAAIKIVCENVDGLNPIGTLMGSGRTCMKESLHHDEGKFK